MLKKLISNKKSEKQMQELAKKLGKNPQNEHTPTAYTAWINEKLGSTKNIENFNKWYGKDFSKKAPKKTDVLLLFPNSIMFNNGNSRKITNQTNLEDIVLDEKNWVPIKLTNIQIKKSLYILKFI